MATANQSAINMFTVGLFNAAAGGYMTDLGSAYTTLNNPQGFVQALVATSAYRVSVYDYVGQTANAQATNIVTKLIGATDANFAAAVTAVQGIITAAAGTEAAKYAAGAYAAINFLANTTDAAYATAKAAFTAKVAAANNYTDNGGNSTNLTTLQSIAGGNATGEAGASFVLTTAQDILTGGGANDTFRAVAGLNIGAQDQTTLNSSDILTGGAGTDTLIVNLTGALYNGGARIKEIEVLRLGTDIAASTFDYNVNQGVNEVTDVQKIIADQINAGEALTVQNVLKTPAGTGSLPILRWANDNFSQGAGTVTTTYRANEVVGAADLQIVELSNINGGTLNIGNLGGAIETLQVVSDGTSTGTNSLVPNANRTNAGIANDTNADLGSASTTKVILTNATAATATAIGLGPTFSAATGNFLRTAGGQDDAGAATVNLLSYNSTVTEVDATGMTQNTSSRFSTSNGNVTGVNVTFRGGSAADYVEFQLGTVSATGGEGADTFSFINTAANSTFGETDTLTGGNGNDTIILGNNGIANGGAATYNIGESELRNKSGIDTIDLRGSINNLTLSADFVSKTDVAANTINVTTANINTLAATVAAATNENVSTNTIRLTELNGQQAVNFTGGQGSDRLILNDRNFNVLQTLDGGVTDFGQIAAGVNRYDTLTVVTNNEAVVIDRNDLSKVSNFEGLILTKSTAAANYTVELTRAFLNANTLAVDNAVGSAQGTGIIDTNFVIGTAAAANSNALAAGDVVTINVADLLTTTNDARAAGFTIRTFDITTLENAGVTVNFVGYGGAAVTLATLRGIGLVVANAGSANAADVIASAANPSILTGTVWTSSAVGATANVLGTNNNDIFNLSQADTVNGGTGTDTVNLNAGSAAAVVTLGAGADTINVNTAIAATGAAVVTTGAASTINIAADQNGDLTQEIVGAFAHTYNVSVAQTTLTVLNTAGATINSSAGGVYVLGAAGQIFGGTATAAQTVTGAAGTDTIAITAANTAAGGHSIAGGAGIDTITITADTGIDRIAFNDGGAGSGVTTAADRDTITGFSATNDLIVLDVTQSTVGTAAGAAAVIQAVATTGALLLQSATADLTVLNWDMGGATAVLAGVTNGAALLANLGGALTAAANTDDGYILAYDNGNAYLYAFTNSTAAGVAAGEIQLIGTFNGVAAGSIGVGQIVLGA